MSDYKRITKDKPFEELDLKDEWGYSHIYKRLQELENKIENKTLIDLPCKVGDVVYYVNEFAPTPRIEECKVCGILIDGKRIVFHTDFWEILFAEEVCFTKAEAEKRLKELREKKC